MAVSSRLLWPSSISLSGGGSEAIVAGPDVRISLRSLAPEIVSAMQRLAPPGEEEDRLEESVLAAGNVDSLAHWFYHIDQLRHRGLLCRSLHADGTPLATLVPLGRPPASSPHNESKHGKHSTEGKRIGAPRSSFTKPVLSRFAYIRRDGKEFVLECPLSHARVVLHDPRALAVIGALSAPETAENHPECTTDLEPDAVSELFMLLAEARMIEESHGDSAPGVAEDSALESWEFHDLLFHTRSRRGRSDGRFGGTYRLPHLPPPPAVKARCGIQSFKLFRPDLEQLERDDPPLAQVQERRRSLRTYSSSAMTAKQLGEFLYRVARVKRCWQGEAHAPSGPVTMEFTERPYPGGGGLYELEFYPVISACRDLSPGLYHYDPQAHALERMARGTRDVELLLQEAAASAGMARETLQVLVIVAARFQRLAWKYESIAYSLMLKDTGVVYQTMYLAATAMGLAPCGLGCGDSDLFARAAGLDYYAESSVGEFLLGSREV